MNRIFSAFVVFLSLSILQIPNFASAQDYANESSEQNLEKTLSPYFLIKSEASDVEQLPLKSTSSDVKISGIIADVTVSQIYKNQGQHPIEAVYIFPASTRAAVYAMRMTIGDRKIEAKVKEKGEARKDYQVAKRQGKSASLLEQQRPNVFQMNVANIMPGDEIKVELKYTETLVPTDNIYEFSYPTVVGPRYSNQPERNAPANESWIQNPYLKEKEAPNYSFDMKVDIAAGLPIKEIISNSHKINVSFQSDSRANIQLDTSEQYSGNKDFILHYRLAGDLIDTGALLYEEKDENFFFLNVQPPKTVASSIIPPREYLFVIDVSGSMDGFPLATAKTLIRDLISNLKPTDRFNVLLFAGDSAVMSETSLPANQDNISRAISMIEGQRGAGGTEIVPALKRGLSLARDDAYSRSFVIITDGYVNVERDVFDLITKNLGTANVFSFGIGTSVNRFLIEGMARAGRGEPFIVTRPMKAASIAEQFRKYVNSPVLTSIKVQFEGFQAYDYEPKYVPDLFAQRPLTIVGKYKGKLEGSIRVTGKSGLGTFEKIIDLSNLKPDNSNSALRYLWARTRIAETSDYNKTFADPEKVKKITELGLKYNLLTDYTSFIAVDEKVRNENGAQKSVKQALPLPEGVSNSAIGGFIPSAPEPETYMLMMLVALTMAAAVYFKKGKLC